MNKLQTLESLLENQEISEFSREWVKNSRTNEETIRQIYVKLQEIGLSDSKIASQANLLGRDPETIDRNYQHHVCLLRQDYKDKNSGRDLLLQQAQLLGISPETMNSNVQFLHQKNINYNDGILLGTTPKLKRKKMAWLLREIFDYRNLQEQEKPEAVEKMHDLVRSNPQYLIKSINSLKGLKDKIKEKTNNS